MASITTILRKNMVLRVAFFAWILTKLCNIQNLQVMLAMMPQLKELEKGASGTFSVIFPFMTKQ